MSVSWLKYIPLNEVAKYKELGWEIRFSTLDGTHHGEHAVAGIWHGEEEPPMPAEWVDGQ